MEIPKYNPSLLDGSMYGNPVISFYKDDMDVNALQSLFYKKE